MLVTRRIGNRDEHAHTVSEEVDRLVRFLLSNLVEVGLEVVYVVVEAVDVDSLAARASVASMIQCVDGEAARHKEIDNVGVAPAVFAVAVGDQQYRTRVTITRPALMIDFDSMLAWERAV